MRFSSISLLVIFAACGGEPPSTSPAVSLESSSAVDQTEDHAAGPELTHGPSDSCANTVGCAFWGRCTLARSGHCEVGSDDDCRASVFCANVGRCSRVRDGDGFRCAARSDEDCRRSYNCQMFGVCQLGRDHTCT